MELFWVIGPTLQPDKRTEEIGPQKVFSLAQGVSLCVRGLLQPNVACWSSERARPGFITMLVFLVLIVPAAMWSSKLSCNLDPEIYSTGIQVIMGGAAQPLRQGGAPAKHRAGSPGG